MEYVQYIIGGIVGGIIMHFVMRTRQPQGAGRVVNEDEKTKAANLDKIRDFIADKDKFTNDDLENSLGVSDTTTGRYLDELEAAGEITQHGDTGSGVYYTKN